MRCDLCGKDNYDGETYKFYYGKKLSSSRSFDNRITSPGPHYYEKVETTYALKEPIEAFYCYGCMAINYYQGRMSPYVFMVLGAVSLIFTIVIFIASADAILDESLVMGLIFCVLPGLLTAGGLTWIGVYTKSSHSKKIEMITSGEADQEALQKHALSEYKGDFHLLQRHRADLEEQGYDSFFTRNSYDREFKGIIRATD